MSVLRIIGYVVAFLAILVVIHFALDYLLQTLDVDWPLTLTRAVTVIITWLIFWFGIWRPLGRRMQQNGGGRGRGRR